MIIRALRGLMLAKLALATLIIDSFPGSRLVAPRRRPRSAGPPQPTWLMRDGVGTLRPIEAAPRAATPGGCRCLVRRRCRHIGTEKGPVPSKGHRPSQVIESREQLNGRAVNRYPAAHACREPGYLVVCAAAAPSA